MRNLFECPVNPARGWVLPTAASDDDYLVCSQRKESATVPKVKGKDHKMPKGMPPKDMPPKGSHKGMPMKKGC